MRANDSCAPQRADFIRIPAGKRVRVTLTSVALKELGELPWAKHPKGLYTLFVRYGTSKIAPFQGVFLGTSGTDKIRLYVK
jgi:hypothetical protein